MTNECKIVNKGTNAGGSKTTFNGSNYEDLTRCDSEIIKLGFEKNIEFYNKDLKNSQESIYYEGDFLDGEKEEITIVILFQRSFKPYMKKYFEINTYYNPDEAYLIKIKNKFVLKILEKKSQNVNGSNDVKLRAGLLFVKNMN